MNPLRNRFWLFVSISITTAIATLVIIVSLIWGSLDPQQKRLLLDVLEANVTYLFAATILFVAVLGFILDGVIQNYILPFKKIKDETRIIVTANPSHRIKLEGTRDVLELVAVINEGAENLQRTKKEVETLVTEAMADSEGEKKILASVMSQLPHGIFICDTDGQIILFNSAARDYFSQTADEDSSTGNKGAKGEPHIGLGRFIFNIMDRATVTHAMDEVLDRMNAAEENPATSFITAAGQGKTVRIEVVPILNPDKEINGFTLIATDISRRVDTENKINFLLRQLTTGVRASSAGIRAAVEAIIEFETMNKKQKKKFLDIIHAETLSLSKVIERTDREMPDQVRGQWSLIPMRMRDILIAVQARADRTLGLKLEIHHDREPKWFRGDSFPLIMMVLFILEQLKYITESHHFEIEIGGSEQLVYLEVGWQGRGFDREYIHQWRDEQVGSGQETLPVTVGAVLEKHHADLIVRSPQDNNPKHHLQLVVPRIKPREPDTDDNVPILAEGRPVFYDFDLFSGIDKNKASGEQLLVDLKFTVFDTETTGLNPRGGDEIISIGAVRIVNTRILREETFDRLVDPRRDVPWESVKIHGIQPGMLKGQPDINQVLPDFFKYSEDTILVGHNVAFDMTMLEMKQAQTGLKFSNPVLDTMLLSAAIHPTHKKHTLEGIGQRLGVMVKGRHTALGDAMATAELLLKMLPLLNSMGIRTLGEAINASRKTYYARLKY
ncbi:MAG: PAS domain-containing protein [Desulfobacterales bacterium]|nr:PAS domain-containing protein [Desulfobacterales bacterium]